MLIATSLNIALKRWPEPQAMPRIAAAGYEGVDFNFADMCDRLDWFDDRAVGAWLEQFEQAAVATGLAFVQGHGPMMNLFGDTPKDIKRRSLCVPAIRAYGRLKVPWMVLHPDVFAGPFDASHRRAILERNVEFFRSLLPVCEKHRVGIAIENLFDSVGRDDGRNCPRFFASVPEELCELVDALNHPLIGVCWDTGHARVMRLDQRAAIRALGPRLKVLHVQDNDGRNDQHLLPFCAGREGVDWDAVTAGLREAGYRGALSLEVHNAFNGIPEPLFESTLQRAAEIARYLVARIEERGV